MQYKELNTKSKEEIDKILSDTRMELMKTNAQVATGTTPKSPGHLKQYKKTIAKILTLKKTRQKTKNE